MAISDKRYRQMLENSENREAVSQALISSANERIGCDFRTNYHIPEDFDFYSITDAYFRDPYKQKISIPFSDEQFTHFLRSEKVMAIQPKVISDKGLVVFCAVLKSKNSSDPANPNAEDCYTLSISRDGGHYKNSFYNFSISLELIVAGKEPLTIARFDSAGEPHPMIFDKNNQLLPYDKIFNEPTPHLHINNNTNQVICSKSLNYIPAYSVSQELYKDRSQNDPLFFKHAMQAFMTMANINAKIMDNETYYFDHNQLLFEFSEILDNLQLKDDTKGE